MKFVFVLLVLAIDIRADGQGTQSDRTQHFRIRQNRSNVPTGVTSLTVEQCTKKYDNVVTDLLNKQIQAELSAQYAYLRLAHIFEQPHMFYPKMAKFFHEKSMEEMTHAEDFIRYQNQRGAKYDPGNAFSLTVEVDACQSIDSLHKGFNCAQDLEIEVTKKLTQLVADVNAVKLPAQATTTAKDDEQKYIEDLRSGQSVLMKCGEESSNTCIFSKQSPWGANKADTITVDDCNKLEVEFIELAEHISHEYLGHQVMDTKVLANVVQTLDKYNPSCARNGQTCPDTENARQMQENARQFQALGSFLADKELNLE